MKNAFEDAVTPPVSEAEQLLIDEEVPYRRQADGSLLALGNLARLPDLSRVIVRGGFTCAYNKLTSLEGAPKYVAGYFSCYDNQLTTLKGAPAAVCGNFSCTGNQLKDLEDAPRTFKRLLSDFGRFNSWDDVPEDLRTSAETKARWERERQFEQELSDMPVLKEPLNVGKPLQLKR